MRSNKLYAIILIFAILFSGCSNKEQTFIEPSTPVTQPPTSETVTVPTVTASPATEPDLSLGVEAGAYLQTYTDQNTSDYLDYYIFIPENAEIDMPLVVFLHGSGEVGSPELLKGTGPYTSAQLIYGAEFPFIFLSPNTHIHSWTNQSVITTLKGLIDEITATYRIDPDRIILTGYSLGAIGVWKTISNYGDLFAAAVPISCGIDEQISYDMCAKVPVLAFAGDAEEQELKYKRAMERIVKQINDAGGTATLTVLTESKHEDTIRTAFSNETFDWMLEQRRSN